jgi:hypothetical protein
LITAQSFAVLLVVASAVLAFWLAARFPALAPKTLGYAVLHVLGGFAAIRAIPGLSDPVTAFSTELAHFLVPFGIALPLLTYAFLAGLWVLRLIHRAASGSSY